VYLHAMPRQLDHMFPQSSLLPPWFHQPQIEPVRALNIAPTNENQCMAIPRIQEYPVRRTFSGSNAYVWTKFLQYFENLAELNAWGQDKYRGVLLRTLRGQAETFAYGLPFVFQRDYNRLKQKMEERFGHTAMKATWPKQN
jgi:hypothetical protein